MMIKILVFIGMTLFIVFLITLFIAVLTAAVLIVPAALVWVYRRVRHFWDKDRIDRDRKWKLI